MNFQFLGPCWVFSNILLTYLNSEEKGLQKTRHKANAFTFGQNMKLNDNTTPDLSWTYCTCTKGTIVLLSCKEREKGGGGRWRERAADWPARSHRQCDIKTCFRRSTENSSHPPNCARSRSRSVTASKHCKSCRRPWRSLAPLSWPSWSPPPQRITSDWVSSSSKYTLPLGRLQWQDLRNRMAFKVWYTHYGL